MTAQLDTQREIDFGPLTIRYDGRVLTPRPWTFMQSTWAAELARGVPDGPIAELCCGAGQIGLAAAVLSDRPLVQVDANATACTYARLNASFAGVAALVDVIEADIEHAFESGERFPLMLADPPYVPSIDVSDFADDPDFAIDGGPAGLDIVSACLRVIAAHLDDRGVALLQVLGLAQAVEVEAMAADVGLRLVAVRSVDRSRAVVCLQRG